MVRRRLKGADVLKRRKKLLKSLIGFNRKNLLKTIQKKKASSQSRVHMSRESPILKSRFMLPSRADRPCRIRIVFSSRFGMKRMMMTILMTITSGMAEKNVAAVV